MLVHCWAGVSRSTTIVISFLMAEHGMSLNDATEHVRKQRWFINPNPGFKNQLKRYERELRTQ